MAIRMLENFAGAAESTNLGTSTKFGDYAATLYATSFQIVAENGKKWLKHNTASASNILLPLSGIVSAGTSKIVIGFRIRRSVTTASGALAIFQTNPTSASAHTYTFAAGQVETYFEIVIDRSQGASSVVTSTLYVDGLQSGSSITWHATAAANLYAGTVSVYFIAGSYTQMTDVYILEDTQDSTPCDRMGPQNIISADMELVSNTGWNATALTDVLARVQNQTDTGTRITGSGVGSELKLKPKASVVLPSQVGKVNGFMVKAHARYTTVANLETIIKRATRSVSKTTTLPSTATNSEIANVKHASSSSLTDEYGKSTALDQVEVSFKVAS